MFLPISNSPRDYAWGSVTAIPELLGTLATGQPQAELWLGTHPGSPSQTPTGSLADLTTLPFLLKVLAAASPLSLQAHPTIAQAVDGFAREDASGVPLDAANRNYKDRLHKPEIIYALTPFRALCGFRPASETRAAIERLLGAKPGDAAINAWLDRLGSDDDIQPVFEWLLSRDAGVDELLSSLVVAAPLVAGPHYSLIGELAAVYPGDPGIAISLMLNLAELQPGEVLYLPAGNIHAYVKGLGIELMAASDNVLRGGLTPKHVDVPELLRVLNFAPLPVPYLEPSVVDGVESYSPLSDFRLLHVTTDAAVALPGEAIALCTAGSFNLNGLVLSRGMSVYIEGESSLAVVGSGQLFVATAGV